MTTDAAPDCRHRTKVHTEHGFSRCVECKETFPDPPGIPDSARLPAGKIPYLETCHGEADWVVHRAIARAAEDHAWHSRDAEMREWRKEHAEQCLITLKVRDEVAQLQEQFNQAIKQRDEARTQVVELVEVFRTLDIPEFREHLADYDAGIAAEAATQDLPKRGESQ